MENVGYFLSEKAAHQYADMDVCDLSIRNGRYRKRKPKGEVDETENEPNKCMESNVLAAFTFEAPNDSAS
jgi:hypothetical protein